MQRPSGKDAILNENASEVASHFMPKTFTDSASINLSLNSRCKTSATAGLLDTHLAKGMAAWFITSEASWINLQHSSAESAPVSQSATYRLSMSSSITRELSQMVLDGGIQQKRTCTIPKWNMSESHVLCLPTQIPQESVHISISLENADL